MVLIRISFLILLIFFSFSGYAQNIQTAKNLFKKQKYAQCLKELNRIPKKTRSANIDTYLTLKGASYHKLGLEKNAIRIFNYQVKIRYKTLNAKILNALKKDEFDAGEMNIPVQLKRLYYYLGVNYLKLYLKNNSKKLYETTRQYLLICEESECSNQSSENLDKLKQVSDFHKYSKYQSNFYFLLGKSISQQSLKLESKTTNEEIVLLTNKEYVTLGLGYRNESSYRGYNFEFNTGYGTGSIQSYTGEYTYLQQPIKSLLFSAEIGYYFKPNLSNSRIGLSLIGANIQSDHTIPEGFEQLDTSLTYGFAINSSWQISSKIGLLMKLASLNYINLTSVVLSYEF